MLDVDGASKEGPEFSGMDAVLGRQKSCSDFLLCQNPFTDLLQTLCHGSDKDRPPDHASKPTSAFFFLPACQYQAGDRKQLIDIMMLLPILM